MAKGTGVSAVYRACSWLSWPTKGPIPSCTGSCPFRWARRSATGTWPAPTRRGCSRSPSSFPGSTVSTASRRTCAGDSRRNGILALSLDFYRGKADPLEEYHDLSDSRALTDLDELHEFVVSDDLEWAVSDEVGIVGIDVGGRFGLIAAATRPWVRSLTLAYTPLTGDEDREHQVANFLDHLPVPVLGLYGAADELISPGTVDEAQNRNQHGQWLLYDGAGHDFLDVTALGLPRGGLR